MSNTQQPQRNFKRVVSGGNWLKPKKWEEWTAGDYVEGEYVNASEMDRYGKPIYEIKVHNKKITGSDPTILTGERTGIMPLYPNGGMMFQMDKASYGDVVRITYKGMAKVTNKKSTFYGKPCHDIEVLIDGYEEEETNAVSPDSAGDDLLG